MDLEFDKMTVDTTLAQEYIKENKDVFELYKNYKKSIETFEPYLVKSKLVVRRPEDDLEGQSCKGKLSDNTISKIQALASSLKQNAALIAQLEYHIRGIPIEDTNVQLNLIIQHLYWHTLAPYNTFNCKRYSFYFYDEPLLKLQYVVHTLTYSKTNVQLVNLYKATTFITHLFVKLCQEAGFDNSSLTFVDASGNEGNFKEVLNWCNDTAIKGYDSGTVAIVSEDADIDSAVDKFLSVSKQAPWRLRRILVQESIYQVFKDALTWKCNLKKQEQKRPDSNVLCSDTLTYNGKSFLIDPVEIPTDQHSMATVEAYRTSKEMISLVQADKARYISLWANDIAGINEFTHNTKSPVVWVNNIADFRGPPLVSAAVFSHSFEIRKKIAKCDKTSKLYDLLQSWQKLDYEARREILCNALDKYITEDSKDNLDFKRSILTNTRQSFVDVGKDYVCVGISEPVGIRLISDFDRNPLSENIFKSILNGNGYAISPSTEMSKMFESKFKVFEQAGVPLVNIGRCACFETGNFEVKHFNLYDRIRVIWTNTGTIFAN